MCTMELEGYPIKNFNIWKTSICPVDKVEVVDLTNDNSFVRAEDRNFGLSLVGLEDTRNLQELIIYLKSTHKILQKEWFHGK